MTHLTNLVNIANDLLFADGFNSDFKYNILGNCNVPYPTNVYSKDDTLFIELSAIGLEQEEIEIEMTDGTLNVSYNKEKLKSEPESKRQYFYRGLTRKAFNLSFKISRQWNTENINAKLEKGLLVISMPIHESSKPKSIKINSN